jgi:hypothetical protein
MTLQYQFENKIRSNSLQTIFKLKCGYSKMIRFVKYPKKCIKCISKCILLKNGQLPCCKMHTLKCFKFYKNFILRFEHRNLMNFLMKRYPCTVFCISLEIWLWTSAFFVFISLSKAYLCFRVRIWIM